MDTSSSSLGSPSDRSHGGGGASNGAAGPRRPTNLMTSVERKLVSPPQNLTLTIHKDSGGYGMKVSGDNPVYVESAKAGGAAQKAGLLQGDMILMVNGTNVRYSTHTHVVQLIKSSTTVELTVQRNYKMQPKRPSSVNVGSTTPVAQRGGITAPVPVDSATSHELKMRKIETLQTYLERLERNLENLKANSRNDNRADIKKAEQTIQSVQKQLQLQYAEDPPVHHFSPITNPTITTTHQQHLHHHHLPPHHHTPTPIVYSPTSSTTTTTPTQAAAANLTPSTPAFLSRFPRSLSSISLGTKKKPSTDNSPHNSSVGPTPAATATTTACTNAKSLLNSTGYFQAKNQHPHPYQHHHAAHTPPSQRAAMAASDIPPPLPQRNMPRKSNSVGACPATANSADDDVILRSKTVQVSDLDHSAFGLGPPMSPTGAVSNNNPSLLPTPIGKTGAVHLQQRSSAGKPSKDKALSDPKVSSQLFIDMEQSLVGDQRHGGGGGASSALDADFGEKLPPPLPPRQPGMLEEKQNVLNNNSGGLSYGNNHNQQQQHHQHHHHHHPHPHHHHQQQQQQQHHQQRPMPNSLDTLLAYPVSTTTQAVRDNFAAFPLTHRPNVQQILQQNQQQQQPYDGGDGSGVFASETGGGSKAFALHQQLNKMNNAQHRRHASSPAHYPSTDPAEMMPDDNHQKSSSGTWDMTESMPADGTPPPRYSPTPHHQHHHQYHHHQQQQPPTQHGHQSPSADDPPATDGPSAPPFDAAFAANLCAGTSMGARGSCGNAATASSGGGTSAGAPQPPIISMEDDEIGDEQDSTSEDHGPFRQLHVLLEPEHVVYSAVFLNFVLSNSNPSPLLFYMITGLYIDGTNTKDMRKWAYEIHSTFLVPRAPLLWCGVRESEQLARGVDTVLQTEHGKIEILRTVFRKGRNRAKEHIAKQLEEFKQKRTAGLGTMFGPSDQQLFEAKGDKLREQKVFEETLLPRLQQLVDELEREASAAAGSAGVVECPKKSALCSALSTVLHRIYVTGRTIPGSPIDRVHHYVSREKSFRSRLMNKTRKTTVRGHNLQLHQYHEVTHCNHCQDIIWGVSPQGYQCANCELNIHRSCSKTLEESCPGPAQTKANKANAQHHHSDGKAPTQAGQAKPKHQSGADSRGGMAASGLQAPNKMTTFFEKIFPQDKLRRQEEEWACAEDISSPDRPSSQSVQRQLSDRRSDQSNVSVHNQSLNTQSLADSFTSSQLVHAEATADVDNEPELRDNSKSKSAPVSVNRSESYKERLSHRRSRNNRRKTSDPSFSKTSDDQGETVLNHATNTASANSSLSSSPTVSMEVVSAQVATTVGSTSMTREWMHSDDEAEPEADWSSNVSSEVLQNLSKAEKERQEIINEIYQTERNHVRTLKLLEGVFYRPLQECGALNAEHLNLLFPPALLTLRDHHSNFEQQLKQRRLEQNSLVSSIGDLLLAVFGGRSGDELKEYSAHFCARQQIALEALKEKRRKDDNLHRFLTKAESHKACRRLQLKDLLPTALQRLTKYPLLFESLYSITLKVNPDDKAEAQAIRRALELSRRILDHVNQAVREAEDAHKLQTIQKKLDRSSYDKEMNEYKNLDLTQHKLLHDGLLISKKNPGVQLHGLLFENIMVLLQKLDDKYILKYHTCAVAGGDSGKGSEARFNPISKTSLILGRNSAVDKNIFFLINQGSSQMMELTAPSSSECKSWVKHISDAADAFKIRTKNNSEPIADECASASTGSKSIADKGFSSSAKTPALLAPYPAGAEDSSAESSADAAASTANESTTAGKGNNDEASQSATGDAPETPVDDDDANDADATMLRPPRNDNDGVGDDDDDNNDDADRSCNKSEKDSDNVRLRIREYSSNPNQTRTLTQQCSLVAPSEVQVSVSPALTAEPVLTLNEKIRRMDESISSILAAKLKIVCEMFRVPNEHFNAIADIVSQPEAPKDLSDITLAVFAQVQSLNEMHNQHIRVTSHQEVSAVSTTTLCDDCHRDASSTTPSGGGIASSYVPPIEGISFASAVRNSAAAAPLPLDASSQPHVSLDCGDDGGVDYTDDVLIDDDGYCEIDELRLPAIMSGSTSAMIASGVGGGIASASASGSSSELMPSTSSSVSASSAAHTAGAAGSSSLTSNDLKRQSTISADSIPEETDHEVRAEHQSAGATTVAAVAAGGGSEETHRALMTLHRDEDDGPLPVLGEQPTVNFARPVSGTTAAVAAVGSGAVSAATTTTQQLATSSCGVNRLAHVATLAPAVPCSKLSHIVTALNAQMTLLLSKSQERDAEREMQRKEIQYLREKVHMLEQYRISHEMESPEPPTLCKTERSKAIGEPQNSTTSSSAKDTTTTTNTNTTNNTTSTLANFTNNNINNINNTDTD